MYVSNKCILMLAKVKEIYTASVHVIFILKLQSEYIAIDFQVTCPTLHPLSFTQDFFKTLIRELCLSLCFLPFFWFHLGHFSSFAFVGLIILNQLHKTTYEHGLFYAYGKETLLELEGERWKTSSSMLSHRYVTDSWICLSALQLAC